LGESDLKIRLTLLYTNNSWPVYWCLRKDPVDKAPFILLLLSGLLVAALFLSRLSLRFRTPDILWFMALGLLLGPSVLGILSGESLMGAGHVFLLGAVFLVLYEAGLRTRIDRVRSHGIAIALLVTLGLLLTSILLAVAVHYLFGLTFYEGLLLGAILSTTDPASILPILRTLPLPPRVSETLVAESALGDVTGSLMTLFILGFSRPDHSFTRSLLDFSVSVLWGGLAGVMIGGLVIVLATHRKVGLFRDNLPVLILSALLAGFGLSLLVHGQALLCAFVLGMVLGQPREAGKKGTTPFSGEAFRTVNNLLAYLASFFIFLVMGTLIPGSSGGVSWGRLLLLVLLLVLVVRPLVVFSLLPFDRRSRFSVREMGFMSVVRETGIMAGALLGLAHDALPAQASIIVISVVVGTIAIGALGSAPMARILGFVESPETRP